MQTTTGTSLSDATATGVTRRRTPTLLAIAAAILMLDQLTKVLAVTQLGDGNVVSVVGDFIVLRLVRNPGAAFSMFTDMTVVLTVIAVAVVLVIAWVSRRVGSVAWAIALGGLLGGALGTLTDRIFREPGPMRGHVVDFVAVGDFPVFNVADSSITLSAILIALLSFRGLPLSGPYTGDDDAAPGDQLAEAGDDAPVSEAGGEDAATGDVSADGTRAKGGQDAAADAGLDDQPGTAAAAETPGVEDSAAAGETGPEPR